MGGGAHRRAPHTATRRWEKETRVLAWMGDGSEGSGATKTEKTAPAYGSGFGLELPQAASPITARGPGAAPEPLTGALPRV